MYKRQEVTIVGDRTGALKSWFDAHTESVVFLRPDRCIAAACIAQLSPETSVSLFKVLSLSGTTATEGGVNPSATGSVLYVP